MKLFSLLIAGAGIIILGFITKNKSVTPQKETILVKGLYAPVAVLELFTSEGCSSCPSADETVARLLAKNKANVYVLSYHVDYWDKLGWKDEFSSASFTQRQNQYASAFGLNSIYTPQVVVNGSTEFVGSDEARLNAATESSTENQSSFNISLTIKRNANFITVIYEINGNTAGQLLNIALIQPEATVSIKRGENGGRTLRHVNIVRSLKILEAAGKGTTNIKIPGDVTSIPLQVVAYTQEKKSLHITAAEKQSL